MDELAAGSRHVLGVEAAAAPNYRPMQLGHVCGTRVNINDVHFGLPIHAREARRPRFQHTHLLIRSIWMKKRKESRL